MIPYERVIRMPDLFVGGEHNETIFVDESSYERLEKEERLRRLFAAYAIQRKWRYIMNKKKFGIVMGELTALPHAADYQLHEAHFEQSCSI